MSRTYNKTCEECGEWFATRGPRQKLCDSCWGEAMSAVRVEYLPSGRSGRLRRTAIIFCRECETEYATGKTNQKHPGLCQGCSVSAGIRTPEARAKIRGKKKSPEHRAKMAVAFRGKRHTPEACAKIAAGNKAANHERRRRGIAQGGKYGFIYVVAGPGQVKVGGSMDADTLAQRLAQHAANGLADVCGTWQVDPRGGATLEAQALAAVLSEWDQVGTTIRPDGGTETVWCDDPQAVVAIVDEISRGCPRKT